MVKRERRVVNGKVPQHAPFHFLLVGFIKDLGFRRIILTCNDEQPSTKSLKDLVIQTYAGVAVISTEST